MAPQARTARTSLLLGSSYLIAAPVLGGQFKAGFLLGVLSQVRGHPDTVVLNEKGPFGLLACKTGRPPVSLEKMRPREGVLSGT